MCNLDKKVIDEINAIAKKYPINKIVLFGSRARGDNKRTSDIDIAVFLLPGFKEKGHLASDIDELNTLMKVDIVFVNENTDIRLLKNIEKEGVVIYERICTEVRKL